MAQKPLSDEQCLEVVRAYSQHSNKTKAAAALGMSRLTFLHRLAEAQRRGIGPDSKPRSPQDTKVNEVDLLRDRVRTLESILRTNRADEITAERVRSAIMKVAAVTAEPPRWLSPASPAASSEPGVPTLFLSDLHWGEHVDPAQINGVNEYSIEIAQRRLRACVDRTIDLLTRHMVNPRYPGIVLALGGDMVSGDIHEELAVTNDLEIMPVLTDLFDCMIWVVEKLADAFGRVFVPAVTGNHGRNTHKMRAKGRVFTNFDWLLYVLLERHFAKEKRVTFHVPSGPDALYRVFGHRYLLTHGDQFRGGDSMIGPLGPITRGDHKKRSRNSQLGQDYDTIVMGHWHQHIALRKLIVNGSLKGYDEYASANNFPFEPPSQALWITHPQLGVTFHMPVYVERRQDKAPAGWVGWSK